MAAKDWLPIVLAGALAVGLVWTLVASIRARRLKRLIDNVPTSKAAGVFIGLVEVKGTAEIETPLVSYLTEAKCVYYVYDVSESWQRWETETYTDSKGKVQMRQVMKSGWSSVASNSESRPFYLQDDTGLVLIQAERADIEASEVFSTSCSRSDPLYYGKGPRHAIPNSTHKRRFTEQAIQLHEALYVLGRARERADVVASEIAWDENASDFLISTRTEARISSWRGTTSWLLMLAGTALAAGGPTVFAKSQGIAGDLLVIALLGGGTYLTIWSLCWAGMAYNSTVDLQKRVDRAWSRIEVELQRRHDLIPNLIAAVRGVVAHESSVQVELGTLRAQAAATAPGTPGADPSACKPTVVALAERYPELVSSNAFTKLQQQLVRTEERIALARGYFNDIASQQNTRIEAIPDGLFARLAGSRKRDLMAAVDFARAVVEVDLAS